MSFYGQQNFPLKNCCNACRLPPSHCKCKPDFCGKCRNPSYCCKCKPDFCGGCKHPRDKCMCKPKCKCNKCCPPLCPPPCPPKKCITVFKNSKLVTRNQDPLLVQPWGIIYAKDTIWVGVNGHVTTYSNNGTILPTVIHIDSADTTPVPTTGIAYNNSAYFEILSGNVSAPAAMIMVNLNGGIDAWNVGVNLQNTVKRTDESGIGSKLSGVAILGGQMFIANFASGLVDIHGPDYEKVIFPPNTFSDPGIPSDYVPFNIATFGGYIYVIYAKKANNNIVRGAGYGYISIFDNSGTLIKRFASQGKLNAPWGMVEIKPSCGLPCGGFLVANHGNGTVTLFNKEGSCYGNIRDENGKEVLVPEIYGLAHGPNNLIYYTATDNDVGGYVGVLAQTELNIVCAPLCPPPTIPCPKPCDPCNPYVRH